MFRPAKTKPCSHCNTIAQINNGRCSHCNCIADTFVYRSKIAAATLAFFGGAVGLHRFYLGQWRGIFYVLFCWTPIPWIAGIIESIIFLSTSQKNWNLNHNLGIWAGRENGKVLGIFIALAVIVLLGAFTLVSWLPFNMANQVFNAQKEQRQRIQAAEHIAQATEHYLLTYDRRPENLGELELDNALIDPAKASIRFNRGQIHLLPYNNANTEIIMLPVVLKDEVLWDCTTPALPQIMLPRQCR